MEKIKLNEDGITFMVHENLSKVAKQLKSYSTSEIVEYILSDNKRTVFSYVASSIDDEQLCYLGKDNFYQCVIKAYAEHRRLTLSPDVIWLKILQELSTYVNRNPEEFRELLVSHSGRLGLEVKSPTEILTEKTDWNAIITELLNQVSEHANGDRASKLCSDFSTTSATEKVVSQLTVMDVMKPYFEYIVHHMICGIPFITLKGTTSDWQRLLDKAQMLSDFNLSWWLDELTPILKEFIKASQGTPTISFWKNILMKRDPDFLEYGGCIPSDQYFNGWILKFYPFDHDGGIQKKQHIDRNMLSEMISVPFKYVLSDGINDVTIPMEIWNGFIGVEEDSSDNSLTPIIGWFVKKSDTDDELANEILNDEFNIKYGINLHMSVKEAPTFLSKIPHFDSLELEFEDYVTIPDWLDSITIDNLSVSGKFRRGDKTKLRNRFPNIKIYG